MLRVQQQRSCRTHRQDTGPCTAPGAHGTTLAGRHSRGIRWIQHICSASASKGEVTQSSFSLSDKHISALREKDLSVLIQSLREGTNHSPGLAVLLNRRGEPGSTLRKYPPLAALDSSFSALWKAFHLITPAEGIHGIQIHFHASDSSTPGPNTYPVCQTASSMPWTLHLCHRFQSVIQTWFSLTVTPRGDSEKAGSWELSWSATYSVPWLGWPGMCFSVTLPTTIKRQRYCLLSFCDQGFPS